MPTHAGRHLTHLDATASSAPSCENERLAIDVGYGRSWQSRFLFAPSHTLTSPSQPPVANVPARRHETAARRGSEESGRGGGLVLVKPRLVTVAHEGREEHEARSGARAVDRVEPERVHREDRVADAVALERVLLRLRLGREVEVLDRDAPLGRDHREQDIRTSRRARGPTTLIRRSIIRVGQSATRSVGAPHAISRHAIERASIDESARTP